MPEAQALFALDPRLENDTFDVAELPLSRLLLMNNAHYPWLILVPQRAGVSEITELEDDDKMLLGYEIDRIAGLLKQLYPGHKLNIGSLGNIVAQLHIHLVMRREGDAAWPGPVWGGPSLAYEKAPREALIERLRNALHKA